MSLRSLSISDWDRIRDFLQNEYTRCGNLFNEDLLRYFFVESYSKIVSTQTVSSAIIEVPYIKSKSTGTPLKLKNPPAVSLKTTKCRADLYYKSDDEVIEFKFHRRSPYSACCTGSDLGSVLNDFNRLSILDNSGKYEIYCCDEDMKRYFTKKHSTNYPMFDFDKIKAGDVFPLIDHAGKKDLKIF